MTAVPRARSYARISLKLSDKAYFSKTCAHFHRLRLGELMLILPSMRRKQIYSWLKR
jgi:hypothetical protein